MKRFIALLLTAVLAVSLCACSQKTEPEKVENSDIALSENENQTTDKPNNDMEDSSETINPAADIKADTDESERYDSQSDTFSTEHPKQVNTENEILIDQSSQTPVDKTEDITTAPPVQNTQPAQESQKPVATENNKPEASAEQEETLPNIEAEPSTQPSTEQEETTMPQSDYKVKITVGSQELTATIYNNATGRDLIEKLPLTLPMLDLYGREMCYRFSEALETDDVQYTGYEVGEIVYWPPRHSFVILYAQNGEQFDMQKVGRIDSGIEIFENIGDVQITIELIS